jgi:hypothetical protein
MALAGASVVAAALACTAENRPVLLIYGFQPIPGFRTTQLWEDFAEHLSGNDIVYAQTIRLSGDHEFYYLQSADMSRRHVFLSNFAPSFEPTVRDVFFYTARLDLEIAAMASRYGVSDFDVVAHSMGGLLARTYVEIDDFRSFAEADGIEASHGGNLRTLVMLATPNHGTMVASIGGWFSTLSRQLEPGSPYLQALNDVRWKDGRLTALNPSVRYVSMSGQTCLGCGLRLDQDACLRACIQEGLAWNGSDLVVMMASAYLPEAENCALIGFDHVRNHTHTAVAQLIDRVLSGERAPDALYNPDLLIYQPD